MLRILFFAGWIVTNGFASNIGRRSTVFGSNPISLGSFKPTCGKLSDRNFGDINTGLKLSDMKTLITFGDSWTDTGNRVGGLALPAVRPKGTCPYWGGRPTNGLMWTEWLAELVGNKAVVKNYAISGATVDHQLWHSASKKADMAGEIDVFICQNNKIDPSTSLATLFFGNNDLSASKVESNDMPSMAPAAKEFIVQTERLINAGLTNLLILIPAFGSARQKDFGTGIWQGLHDLKTRYPNLKFITVDLSQLYNAIKAAPPSFGYHSSDSCLPKNNNVAEACSDPNYRLYWISQHPQTYTHKLQAQFIKLVSETCTVPDSNDSTSFSSPPPTGSSSSENGATTSSSPDQCKNVPVPLPPRCS